VWESQAGRKWELTSDGLYERCTSSVVPYGEVDTELLERILGWEERYIDKRPLIKKGNGDFKALGKSLDKLKMTPMEKAKISEYFVDHVDPPIEEVPF
jgi:hypothetical protein